jgi:ABC-type Fe3+/spermidine/putrescine transport system ATPase subunit
VADRIAVMDAGRILQIDSPEAIYRSPRSAAVARFLGLTNLIPGELAASDIVQTPLGRFPLPPGQNLPAGPLILLIRPEATKLMAETDSIDALVIKGRVTATLFQGDTYEVTVDVDVDVAVEGQPPLRFTLPARPKPPAVGEPIRLRLDPDAMAILAVGD